MKRKWLGPVYAAAGAILALGMSAAPAHAIEVLLLWDDAAIALNETPSVNPHTQALIDALEADDCSVTLSNNTQHLYTGLNPAPAAFDVVVHLNGNIVAADFGKVTQGALKLAEYVESGGGYICSEFNAFQSDAGSSGVFLRNITPFESSGSLAPTDRMLTTTAAGTGHPVLDGITSPFSYITALEDVPLSAVLRSFSSDSAVALANDIDGNPAIGIREFGAGRVVMFNHKGNYRAAGQLSDVLTNATAQQLYVNAVKWADQKAPTVKSITADVPFFTGGPEITWTVEFSEAVTGVDLSDFDIELDLSPLDIGSLSMQPISAKVYEVTLDGISGFGSLNLQVLANGSIKDLSVGEHPLAAAAESDPISVDGLPPQVISVSTSPALIQQGSSGFVVVQFDESMKQSVAPTVILHTAANDDIATSSGAWSSFTTYQAPLARALTGADAGLATVEISGAQDFSVGNVMIPSNTFKVQLVSAGLEVTLNKKGPVLVEVGAKYTFSVDVVGAVGALSYQWYKEDSAKADLPIGPDDSVFVIQSLDYSDAGTYYCVVSDFESSVTSPSVTLNVVASVPAAGALGLAALSAALAAITLRKRRR
ncbi:MAG: hypothetical protein GC168_14510 [Candidatus Hydrogenedens sp.]|nr:hypothetical protein [Candidatus Hydrogenedens sp.]